MNNEPFKSILCVFENADDSVVELIQKSQVLAESQNVPLKLLCVLPSQWFSYSEDSSSDIQQKARDAISKKLSKLFKQNKITCDVDCEVRFGKPFIEIIHYQQLIHAGLVIKKADKKPWLPSAIASNDLHLLRKCPIPVYLMRKDKPQLPEKILVAVDFDRDDPASHANELNTKMLDTLARYFDTPHSECTLYNAFEPPQAGFISLFADNPDKTSEELVAHEKRFKASELNLLSRAFTERLSPRHLSQKLTVKLERGLAAQKIPEYLSENNTDLLIIGTVARTGVPGLLIGNTAEEVLLNATCDVLALKPDSFKSPILEQQ